MLGNPAQKDAYCRNWVTQFTLLVLTGLSISLQRVQVFVAWRLSNHVWGNITLIQLTAHCLVRWMIRHTFVDRIKTSTPGSSRHDLTDPVLTHWIVNVSLTIINPLVMDSQPECILAFNQIFWSIFNIQPVQCNGTPISIFIIFIQAWRKSTVVRGWAIPHFG